MVSDLVLKNIGQTTQDFTVLKIDMCNAFNLVSHQALLNDCATCFPELLPWAMAL